MIFTFPKFTLDIDIEKTKAYYNSAHLVSADCSCSGCRNYEQAIDILPKDVTSFFSQMGIDMKKIREVYVNYTNTDDTVYYGGFYHVCGNIVEGESAWISDTPSSKHWEDEKAYPITQSLKVSFKNDCDLLEKSFPLPAIQLEISADIPWVLAEQNDYEKDMERKRKGDEYR